MNTLDDEKKFLNFSSKHRNIAYEGRTNDEDRYVGKKGNVLTWFANSRDYLGSRDGKKDDTTGIPMFRVDGVGKNYECFVGEEKEKNVCSNRNYKGFVLFHYQKKKNIRKLDIGKYFAVEDGEVKPKKALSPEKIYEVAKKIYEDAYLFVTFDSSRHEVLVPMSKWVAEQVFKNGGKVELNKYNHVAKVFDKDGKEIKAPDDDIGAKIQEYFGKNVTADLPYAYTHMAIRNRVLNYRHNIRDRNGRNLVVISQYTNELVGRYTTAKKKKRMTRLMKKIGKAVQKVHRLKDRNYVFTGSYPLPNEQHMVSFCIVIKRGHAIVYMINSNGWKKTHDRYALPVKRDFQAYIRKFIPELRGKVSYRYVNQSAQRGGTCMTHADYITRHLAKDPKVSFDGTGVHPMKICFLAMQRGLAVDGLYRPTKQAGKFIPDDIDSIQASKCKTIQNVKPSIDNQKRNAYKKSVANKKKRGEFYGKSVRKVGNAKSRYQTNHYRNKAGFSRVF